MARAPPRPYTHLAACCGQSKQLQLTELQVSEEEEGEEVGEGEGDEEEGEEIAAKEVVEETGKNNEL